jgi:hypothetical protein
MDVLGKGMVNVMKGSVEREGGGLGHCCLIPIKFKSCYHYENE